MPRGRANSGSRDSLLARPLTGEQVDMRLVPIAAALWAGTILGLQLQITHALLVCAAGAAVGMVICVPLARGRSVVALAVLCLAVGVLAGGSRAAQVRDGPVVELAEQEAQIRLDGVVAADPELRQGEGGDERGPASEYVLVRFRVDTISGRGDTHQVRTPVLVVASGSSWNDLLPGQRVRTSGRLSPADGGDVAAFVRVTDEPELVGEPGTVARAGEPLRAGLREAVTAVPEGHRGLIPGMVVGDESMMSDELREEMRVTGLTHLTAVSGTHVGIVLLAILGVARLIGVRGYALPVIAVIGVAGFVLLVRPEPSVLRAAVMGTVAVLGVLVAGRRRALPALATAVIVLVLVEPWLALSLGFVLSVSATAGIVVLVPSWQDAMGWLPRPVALAVAVPLAAQVACTPVLLASFGQFSVASVPANMLVGPVVALAMVLGLAATVVSPLLPPVAAALAWTAGLPAWWIASVAAWFAHQPGAEFEWPDGRGGAVIGVALSLGAIAVLPLLLRRPVVSFVTATVLVFVLLRAMPTPGWPPRDWLMVICDVGQGDAVVLHAGPGSAVVVDTGPDPLMARRCLDSLGIDHVPLLVLSHFHADHVDGVPGVLAGRRVGHAMVSPLEEPGPSARRVTSWLGEAQVPVEAPRVGERRAVGAVTVEVLWPRRRIASSSESDANNASVVLMAEVDGVEILLTGDIEPAAQRALLNAEPELNADVLKVAHHGSRHQDERMLTDIGAELALVGVGENTHGHPDEEVLELLTRNGTDVRRTDEDGTVAVIRTADRTLATVAGVP
ncbi:ComEC/Rec2 family competence protein [Phytoactinopolyspora endophytica]|uniref:ComEC/Rec2 family competence protein n=1 Tax=Phytoactinopolyspora endophytica TaxID=1642495 RepID=UPI00197B79F3|nr:ComEC/Rec2 family competence protein [Phytoactinopolyspora endophytica]